MEVRGQRVVVVGAGASGIAAARLLTRLGAEVVINDSRERDALGARADEAEALGATLALGGHEPTAFEGAAAIVLSPGVPPLDVVADARARGVEVLSEVELAYRYLTAPVVAITGTNGKSTVTTLVGAMLEREGFVTFVGGNLGDALSDAVGSEADRPGGRVVVELSSFQLEEVSSFRPKVAALLNVSEDHLDRYDDFRHYARTKARIFAAQGIGCHAVVPASAPHLADVPDGVSVHLFGQPSGEVRVVDGSLTVDSGSVFGSDVFALPTSELRLVGKHNEENAAAAALIARLAGASPGAITSVLREAEGLHHRAELVRELDGVRYIDDSKATNVGAAVAALDGLASAAHRAVLIAGGVDKGGSYAPLIARLAAVGRGVVLIGEAADLIADALDGALPVERAPSMADAVRAARGMAQPGDLVILAPACSSYDMYRSYAHRGDDFQDAVRALGGEA